jgi:Uma2 family endonuclease
MARATESVSQRRFTVAEYHRMAESGVFSPDERVELVRGVIHEMSPKNRPHVIASTLVFGVLQKKLEGRASVYLEAPLVFEALDSEPQPDVVICSNPDINAYGTSGTTALLVVEIAHSSLRYDLGEKAALYAEAGIPEYWVVNLVERVLAVFRDPGDGTYQVRLTLERTARASLEAWPDVELDVASLFPSDAAHTPSG